MQSRRVIFISAGMTRPKKGNNALSHYNLYLNYGLLGLASLVAQRGVEPVVIHGRFDSPEKVADDLLATGNLDPEVPLFLSLPSVFAIPWASRFCRKVKCAFPAVRIVAGGRWVLGENGAWVRSRIPEINLCVYGTAEDRVVDLIEPKHWPHIPYTDVSPAKPLGRPATEFPSLNYSLMPDYLDFQPSLEVSRGCGMGCNFCLEAEVPLSAIRNPVDVANTLLSYKDLYASDRFTTYFEASFFRPSTAWVKDFVAAYQARGLSTQWRCESRVDGLTPRVVRELAAAGLKVVDLGLETASPIQLRRMGKTESPDVYLKRASSLLRECRDTGVWAKVNVLLFAGETEETLKETLGWLDKHADCIKGVSVNPLVVYGTTSDGYEYLDTLRKFGAEAVDETALARNGYASLHLSSTIGYEAAEGLVNTISQRYMTQRNYYDLKSFSYFPRWLTYEVFVRITAESPDSEIPFAKKSELANNICESIQI